VEHYHILAVVDQEVIIQEQREEHLLAELEEQVYQEQVQILRDHLIMEPQTEVAVVEVMVKHQALIVVLQVVVVQELFI